MIPILLGIAGIVITVCLHAAVTSIVLGWIKRRAVKTRQHFGKYARNVILAVVTGCLAIKHSIDIVLWAISYWILVGDETLNDLETAVYFSAVTYTALGYGDLTLDAPWRIMSGMQAMNGILMFGWSTALIFLIVQKLWITPDKFANK